ncbi:hypothetical protein LZ31DRAFT_60157 [Colletotrichum somersetense]|nr:hypothetical protein LZ31DRAFT_60157 [Colletotrichum somersetense]
MSAKINLIRGADGQLLYKASDGHWYPYSSVAHSRPSYDSSEQYIHNSTHSQRSTQQEEPQYDDEDSEAGSFQGDSYLDEESRKATSSTRGESKKRVLKYVEDQRKEREHRDEPRDNSRSRRRAHKKSIKNNIDKILGPLKN